MHNILSFKFNLICSGIWPCDDCWVHGWILDIAPGALVLASHWSYLLETEPKKRKLKVKYDWRNQVTKLLIWTWATCATWLAPVFKCHLPFLAGILIFLTLHLGLTSRVTATYLYEGLVAAAIWTSCCGMWQDTISNTCHSSSCCLNSKIFFPILDNWYCNPERGFKPET